MITLSHGVKKPQDGIDAGSAWFPAMELNMQILNDHTHNLVDSAQLALLTQNILSANWTPIVGIAGLFSQTITMPAGLLYDVTDMFFRLSTGEAVYPSITRVSATQYTIFFNDNTKSLTAFYR